MSLKLNEEELFHLLDLYESHECLWNICHANYKNRTAREEAFTSIQTKLGLPNLNIHELKNKIKSLRSTYNQELSKILRSQENGNYIYKPQLIWFDRVDSFLRPSAEFRKQALKMSSEKQREERVTIIVSKEGDDLKELLDDEQTVEISTATKSQVDIDEVWVSEPRQDNTKPPAKKPKKDSSAHLDSIDASLKDIKNRLYDKLERPDCEFELFGRHIGAQLKSMPLTSALQLQAQIQQLITMERLRLVQQNDSDTNVQYLN